MALRVLLADESATIKKVIQLALQDFGVEVKSVPVGLDVLPVAKSFRPDVVFIDVLLTKRNGYEVCHDLKQDPELKKIPVILMWSGFMELDQGKVLSSGVDRSIEKPFDPEQLRAVVKELVPHLQTNILSSYLKFPDRPEFVEQPRPGGAAPADDLFGSGAEPGEEAEDFKHVPLPRNRDHHARNEQKELHKEELHKESDEWSQADLAQFRVTNVGDDISLPEIDEQDVNDSPIVWSSTGEEVSIHNFDNTSIRARSAETKTGLSRVTKSNIDPQPPVSRQDLSELSVPNLNFERAEQILREQSREVLESIAWRILPDIVERIVREELQKLLKDSERLDEI